MTHVVSFLLFIAALIIHEAGHAIAMTRRKIGIEEAGIGLPVKYLTLTLRPGWLPYPVKLSPILLGAYVKPSEAGERALTAMRFRDRAVCYGAGVVMNLVFGGLLYLLIIGIRLVGSDPQSHDFKRFAIGGGVTLLVIAGRRWLCYVAPLLGLAMLGLIVWLLLDSPDNIGGPIAAVSMAASPGTWIDVLIVAMAITLSLGLFNTIPLIPFDGGRVAVAMLEALDWKRLATGYTYATGVVALCFFGFLIVKDLFSL